MKTIETIICPWCEGEIQNDNGDINVNGMHEACDRESRRVAACEDAVESPYWQ